MERGFDGRGEDQQNQNQMNKDNIDGTVPGRNAPSSD
jgi:hypothetical protein